MYRFVYLVAILAIFACAESVPAGETVDPERYLRQQGWEPFDGKPTATSPSPDIAPLMYYDQGNSVPSCGLVIASRGDKAPGFIELVGSDPGVGYPQCLDIASITPFRMQDEDYIAVEYLSRDTREDTYRGYHYLMRDRSRGIVTNHALTGAVPLVRGGRSPPEDRGGGAGCQAGA